MTNLLDKVTVLYLERCAPPAVRALADDILLGSVWSAAGEARSDQPYRGQVALAIGLENALTPQTSGCTGKQARDWNDNVLALAENLENCLSSPPPNLLALQPGIDLPEPWEAHVLGPIQTLRTRLQNARYQTTIQGGQASTHVKHFTRMMTLVWRGMGIHDNYRLTASMVRVHFNRESYDASRARRDVEAQSLPGTIMPWGLELSNEEWFSAMSALMQSKTAKNSEESADFLANRDLDFDISSNSAFN